MTNGDVAGTYWALMTCKAAPRTVRIRAYNEVHMLSHLMGKSSRDDIKRIRQLEAAHAEIARKLEQARARALSAERGGVHDKGREVARAVIGQILAMREAERLAQAPPAGFSTQRAVP